MGNTIDGGFSHGLILRKKKSLITTFFSLLHGLFHVIPFIVLLFGWHGCSICLGTKKRYRPPHLERGMPSDPFGSQYHVGTKHHKCKPTWSVEKNHGWRRICIHEYIPYVHIFIYNTRIYIYTIPPRVSSSKSQPLAVVQRDFVVELSLVSLKFRIL